MRLTRYALPALAALAVFVPASGHADPYRWCAEYSGDAGGATNCGFVTIEQCMATVSGIGGFCVPNQFYNGIPFDSQRAAAPVRRHKTAKRVREY